MSDFWFYFKIGLQHVLDWQAYDHVLFLLVLVAGYMLKDWKKVVVLVTVFTIGHMFSMALSVYNIVNVSGRVTELLIPITIIVTGIYNIAAAGQTSKKDRNILLLVTVCFGLIHGLGFSSYFKVISSDLEAKGIPLVAFGIGIEAAQCIAVLVVLLCSGIIQILFRFSKRDWIIVLSAIVVGITIPMLMEKFSEF